MASFYLWTAERNIKLVSTNIVNFQVKSEAIWEGG